MAFPAPKVTARMDKAGTLPTNLAKAAVAMLNSENQKELEEQKSPHAAQVYVRSIFFFFF